MTAEVRVRVLRPFRVRGAAFAPGAIVSLDPLDAHSVLGVRAELLDSTDHAAIAKAVQEANRTALAAERRDRPWR